MGFGVESPGFKLWLNLTIISVCVCVCERDLGELLNYSDPQFLNLQTNE